MNTKQVTPYTVQQFIDKRYPAGTFIKATIEDEYSEADEFIIEAGPDFGRRIEEAIAATKNHKYQIEVDYDRSKRCIRGKAWPNHRAEGGMPETILEITIGTIDVFRAKPERTPVDDLEDLVEITIRVNDAIAEAQKLGRPNKASMRYDKQGFGGVYEMVEEIATGFKALYSDRAWDGEWLEAIDTYFENWMGDQPQTPIEA